MTAYAKRDLLIPAGLLALSTIPIIAGSLRVIQLGVGTEITAENARFWLRVGV